jgi:hypothetical protein
MPYLDPKKKTEYQKNLMRERRSAKERSPLSDHQERFSQELLFKEVPVVLEKLDPFCKTPVPPEKKDLHFEVLKQIIVPAISLKHRSGIKLKGVTPVG